MSTPPADTRTRFVVDPHRTQANPSALSPLDVAEEPGAVLRPDEADGERADGRAGGAAILEDLRDATSTLEDLEWNHTTTPETEWRLAEAKPVGPDGVLVLIYERAR